MQNNKLSAFRECKLREMPQDLAVDQKVEFTSVIVGCATLAGIKNADDRMMLAIREFIRSKFSMLTLSQIRQAFEMNCAGELTVNGKPEVIKHYGSFDATYVGEILSAYREKLAKVNRKNKLLSAPVINDEVVLKKTLDYYEMYTKWPKWANYGLLYDWLAKGIKVDEKEKKRVYNACLKEVKCNQLLDCDMQRNIASIQAKKELFLKYFDRSFLSNEKDSLDTEVPKQGESENKPT